MADVVTKFRLETTQFDSALRDTSKGLNAYVKEIQKAGEGLTDFSEESVEAARALGTTESGANNTKNKLYDLVGAYNDAAKAYNTLNEEQKNTDFGKAMSDSLRQLQERIKETKQEFYGLGDAAKEVANESGGLFGGGKFDGMLQVLGGNLMTKGVGMLTGLASEIGDSIKQSVELARQGEGIRIAFERLGRGDILDGLRQATHGTVTDLELIKAAVKFNDFKLPIEELGTMLAFAQQKAKDTGQSVDYMVDSIVTGLGRKSLPILDNLGLSATTIRERMEETGDMTKAVGDIIREQMAAAGDYVETAADRALQSEVELKNAMDDLGRTLEPLAGSFSDTWNSIKIGALDLLNSAIKPLIDSLTEAGRLRKALENAQGVGANGSTRVSRNLDFLKGTSEQYREQEFRMTQANYQREVNRRAQILQLWNSSDRGDQEQASALAYQQFGAFGIEALRNQLKAWQTMLKEYQEGAKEILQPITPEVDTSDAVKSVDELRVKLIELEAQRKKAVAAGDTELTKNLTKQINRTKADIKILSSTSTTTTTTTTTHRTEEQRNTEQVTKLTEEYQRLADAAKTADEAQGKGIAERMAAIRAEIKTLNDRNKELARFAEEAKTVQFPTGTIPQLSQQLRDLQKAQADALTGTEWNNYQKQIEQTQYQLDALKGKWKQGMQATFTLQTEQPKPIDVVFRADDADVLEKVRDIDGVTIDDKSLTVKADTQYAIAALARIEGLTIHDKSFDVVFKADDADVLEKVRDIEGVTIDDKSLTVTANTQDSIAALARIDGLTIQDKDVNVALHADETDVLSKIRDIEGVVIDGKTLTVTADTAEAYNKVNDLLTGIDGTTVTFTVQAKMAEGLIGFNEKTMGWLQQTRKGDLATAEYGSQEYNDIVSNLVDINTVKTLVEQTAKAGITAAQVDLAPFWERVFDGENITETEWEQLTETINEHLQSMDLQPIAIDFQTGNLAKDGKTAKESWQEAANAVSAVGNALRGIEDPTAKVMGIIAQAIANIALGFAQATAKTGATSGVFGWIAAVATGIGTMVSTINAIHSATGYADGGIIKGNSYSGDNIPADNFVNAGELILNRAQQNNVAGLITAAENGGGQSGYVRVSGEQLLIPIFSTLKRQGFAKGEYIKIG